MFDIGFSELTIVLVVVVLLFGPGRLAKVMGEIGTGIRSFREAFTSAEKSTPASEGDSSRASPDEEKSSSQP